MSFSEGDGRIQLASVLARTFWRCTELVARGAIHIGERLNRLPRIMGRTESKRCDTTQLLEELARREIIESRDNQGLGPSLTEMSAGSSISVVLAKSPDGLSVVKATDSPKGRIELERAVSMADSIHTDPRLESWARHVPRVLTHGAWRNIFYAVEEFVSQPPSTSRESFSPPLLRDVLRFIDGFHSLTAELVKVGDTELELLVDQPLRALSNARLPLYGRWRSQHLARLGHLLRKELNNSHQMMSWTHGDLHRGNLIARTPDPQTWALIDWGRGSYTGLSLLDGVYFLLTEFASTTGQELGPCVSSALRVMSKASSLATTSLLNDISNYVESKSTLDPRVVVLLTWLQHVHGNISFESTPESDLLWTLRTVDTVLFATSQFKQVKRSA